MSPKKPFRYWPVVAVAAIAGAMLLSNQTAPFTDGGQAVTNDAQYQAGMTKVQGLTQSRIVAYDQGKPLTSDDKAKLREAGGTIDRMNAFLPRIAGLYFLSGKIHHILGEDAVAEERYLQCTLNASGDAAANPANAAEIRAVGAQASYELSLLLLNRRDFEGALAQAEAAIKGLPAIPISAIRSGVNDEKVRAVVASSSRYRTARASALNELRRTEEARLELANALRLDPTNKRAATLLRLIEDNSQASP